MTSVLAVSDSHGDLTHLPKLIASLTQPIDWLLHAGDHFDDALPIARAIGVPTERVRMVVGNCDYPRTDPVQETLTIDGVSIWVTHGHHFRVKERLDAIYYRAVEVKAQVAVFGHSHVPVLAEDGGVLLFNPGSLSAPRRPSDPPSCGQLEIVNGAVQARHIWLR